MIPTYNSKDASIPLIEFSRCCVRQPTCFCWESQLLRKIWIRYFKFSIHIDPPVVNLEKAQVSGKRPKPGSIPRWFILIRSFHVYQIDLSVATNVTNQKKSSQSLYNSLNSLSYIRSFCSLTLMLSLRCTKLSPSGSVHWRAPFRKYYHTNPKGKQGSTLPCRYVK